MKFICADQAAAHVPSFFSDRIVVTYEPLQQALRCKDTVTLSETIVSLGGDAISYFRLNEHDSDAIRVPGTHSADISSLETIVPGVDGLYTNWQPDMPTRKIALSTADCLAVSIVCHLGSQVWGSLFHAGWRGYTSAIHHQVMHQLATWSNQQGFSTVQAHNSTRVCVGPAIFGKTYQCGQDVALAVQNLEDRFLSRFASFDAVFYRQLCNSKCSEPDLKFDGKIYPDLQLMMAYELVSLFGIPAEKITVIRENTYGHASLPSFRFRTLHGGDTKQRLFTHLRLGPDPLAS